MGAVILLLGHKHQLCPDYYRSTCAPYPTFIFVEYFNNSDYEGGGEKNIIHSGKSKRVMNKQYATITKEFTYKKDKQTFMELKLNLSIYLLDGRG